MRNGLAEPGECFIVKVIRSSSGHYWFSNQRVLLERAGTVNVIVEYGRVHRASLMLQDIVAEFRIQGFESVQRAQFDRIELEVESGELVVLEGLSQAYWPALQFPDGLVRPPARRYDPFQHNRKLRIQFRKEIRKGATSNAELDPAIPACVTALAEPGGRFIVKVIRSTSGHYWFSDRRLLLEAPPASSSNMAASNGALEAPRPSSAPTSTASNSKWRTES